MATDIAVRPATACSLYAIEDTLAALVNSIDLCESPEDRKSILAEIAEALRSAREKRDRVVAFLRHCADQEKFADDEIARLEARKRQIARVRDELERYVIRVIAQCVPPDRKGIQRLEGNVSTMRLQKNPDTVLVTDIGLVPLAYKDAVVTLPAYAWEALLNCVPIEERKQFEQLVKRLEYRADKRELGKELRAGTPIAGADLQFGDLRLIIT